MNKCAFTYVGAKTTCALLYLRVFLVACGQGAARARDRQQVFGTLGFEFMGLGLGVRLKCSLGLGFRV